MSVCSIIALSLSRKGTTFVVDIERKPTNQAKTPFPHFSNMHIIWKKIYFNKVYLYIHERVEFYHFNIQNGVSFSEECIPRHGEVNSALL
jgi:hypothetical protein